VKDSALEVIKEKVLVRERPKEDATTSQKQRRTGGNATVNTVEQARIRYQANATSTSVVVGMI
jgi:hypothetical protein